MGPNHHSLMFTVPRGVRGPKGPNHQCVMFTMPRPHNPLRVQPPARPWGRVFFNYAGVQRVHYLSTMHWGRVAVATCHTSVASNEATFAACPRRLQPATAAVNKRCIDVVCCYCEQCYAGARNRCFAPMAYMTTTWSCGTRACPVRDKVNIFPTISSSPKHVKKRGLHLSSSASRPSAGTGGTSE